jgi:hypothetical protein
MNPLRYLRGTSSNNDIGWRDITGAIDVRGVGANDPAWTQIGSGPFYGYKFIVNDQCWFVYHIPHDIADDTVYFHSHWISNGTSTATVKWEYVYSYAKGFNQAAFNTTGTTVYSEEAASGTAYQHMVTETAGATISGLTEPDGLIIARVRRVTNGGTDNADNIYLLTADLHYLSNSQATPGKAPNFYNA